MAGENDGLGSDVPTAAVGGSSSHWTGAWKSVRRQTDILKGPSLTSKVISGEEQQRIGLGRDGLLGHRREPQCQRTWSAVPATTSPKHEPSSDRNSERGIRGAPDKLVDAHHRRIAGTTGRQRLPRSATRILRDDRCTRVATGRHERNRRDVPANRHGAEPAQIAPANCCREGAMTPVTTTSSPLASRPQHSPPSAASQAAT